MRILTIWRGCLNQSKFGGPSPAHLQGAFQSRLDYTSLHCRSVLGNYVSSNMYVRYYVPLPRYLVRAADRLLDSSISTTDNVTCTKLCVLCMISP